VITPWSVGMSFCPLARRLVKKFVLISILILFYPSSATAFLPYPPMPNDQFANAMVVSNGVFALSGTVSFEPGEPAARLLTGSVWFSLAPSMTNEVFVAAHGFGSGPRFLVIYRENKPDQPALTVEKQVSTFAAPLRLSFVPISGVTYRIGLYASHTSEAFVEGQILFRDWDNTAFERPKKLDGLAWKLFGDLGAAGADAGADTSEWFEWTAPKGGMFGLTPYVYSPAQLQISIFKGDSAANLSRVSSEGYFFAEFGNRYRIRATAHQGSQSIYAFRGNFAPDNDLFANRTIMSGQTNRFVFGDFSGGAQGAGFEPTEPSQFGDAPSVWYEWVCPATAGWELSGCCGSLYSGTALTNLLTLIRNSTVGQTGFRGEAGKHYLLQALAAPYAGHDESGLYREYSFWLELVRGPTNDDFKNALALSLGQSQNSTTLGATLEPGDPLQLSTNSFGTVSLLPRSVWFAFIAPEDGRYQVRTQCQRDDLQVSLYEGDDLRALAGVSHQSISYQEPQPSWGGRSLFLNDKAFQARARKVYLAAVRSVAPVEFSITCDRAVRSFDFKPALMGAGQLVFGSPPESASAMLGLTSGSGATAWYHWIAPKSARYCLEVLPSGGWAYGVFAGNRFPAKTPYAQPPEGRTSRQYRALFGAIQWYHAVAPLPEVRPSIALALSGGLPKTSWPAPMSAGLKSKLRTARSQVIENSTGATLRTAARYTFLARAWNALSLRNSDLPPQEGWGSW